MYNKKAVAFVTSLFITCVVYLDFPRFEGPLVVWFIEFCKFFDSLFCIFNLYYLEYFCALF